MRSKDDRRPTIKRKMTRKITLKNPKLNREAMRCELYKRIKVYTIHTLTAMQRLTREKQQQS